LDAIGFFVLGFRDTGQLIGNQEFAIYKRLRKYDMSKPLCAGVTRVLLSFDAVGSTVAPLLNAFAFNREE